MIDVNIDTKALKTEDAILKAAAEKGAGTLTDMSVFVRFAMWLFALGVAFKAGTFKPNNWNMLAVFTAFDKAFRDASNGFRKPLADASVKTWVSAFGAYWEAGQFTAYPIADIAEKTMNLPSSVPFTSRGARLRKVMEDYKTVAPTEAQLDAILNPIEKPKENPLNDFAKRLVKMVGDDALTGTKANPSPLFAASRETDTRLAALLKLRIALDAFEIATRAKAGEAAVMSDADKLAAIEAKIAAEKAAASQNGATP